MVCSRSIRSCKCSRINIACSFASSEPAVAKLSSWKQEDVVERKRHPPCYDKSDWWHVGGGSGTLNDTITWSKCPNWWCYMGRFCPLTGCSLEMLRESVCTMLSFSIAVFICSLPPKSSPCWSQTECCFWPLLQRQGLSLVLWKTFLCKQEMSDSRDSSRSFPFLNSSFLGHFLRGAASPF